MTTLTGTSTLSRLILRRDRVRIAVWVLAVAGLAAVVASGIKAAFPTASELEAAAAALANNPVQIALNGPAHGLATLGGRVTFEVWNFELVAVALMSMFMVGRHTRGEEESGRLELVRAAAVGRHAPVTASLIVVTGMNLLVAAGVAVSLIMLDLPVLGSLTLGAAFAAVGLVFAGVAAIAAQVTENTRVVSGITGGVLAVSFLLRAMGDAGSGTLSWVSPLGWAQASRPFAGERWWPLLLALGLAAALPFLAGILTTRRDLGAGLIPPRPGPPTASRNLTGPVGLAFRLQRGGLIGWSIGLFLAGLAFGSVGQSIEDIAGDNPDIQDVFAQAAGVNLTDAFFATSLLFLALLAGGQAIQSAHRIRSEETSLRTEPVLATAVSRWRYAASHLVVTLTTSAVVLATAGLGTGIAYAAITGDASQVPRLLGSALAYLPAIWVLAGLTAALFGIAPRLIALAWAGLLISLVVGLFGQLLDLPGWLNNLSPFHHTPTLPAAELAIIPLAILVVAAAGMHAIGLVGLRNRDVG